MFAISDRSTKRRIAGCLGGALGASLLLLAAYPGIAAAAPAAPTLDKLTLTSVCTLPDGDAVFRVGNINALAVTYTWDINKTSFAGKGVAPAGDSYLRVPVSSAGNTRLFVDGKQQASRAQNDRECVLHVQPVKQWLDASGAALTSPTVPKGWKLTLDSDLETLTCTWKKDALSCASKVDKEDKGEFTNEKPYLDVPFGGSYTISETATPDYKQNGTGSFGPLDQPKDLDAYFAGDDTVVVVVTNQSGSATAPTTVVAEEPTTTTTIPVDEPTTTVEALVIINEQPTTTVEVTTTVPTTDAPTTDAAVTTLAPVTTDAPTTTLPGPAPTESSTTTIAPATHELDPTGVEGIVVRAETTAASTAELEAGVEPASDTLPVTGAATAIAATVGFLLVGLGVFVLVLARRRLV